MTDGAARRPASASGRRPSRHQPVSPWSSSSPWSCCNLRAAARSDHLRHQARPAVRPGRLPGAQPEPVERRLGARRAAEPGLRLPVPDGSGVLARRRARRADVGVGAAVVGRGHAARRTRGAPARFALARDRHRRRGPRRTDLHARAPGPDDGGRPQRRDAARRACCRGPCCRWCSTCAAGSADGSPSCCRRPPCRWMGGQNATLVLACLVLPALLLALADRAGAAPARPRPRRRGALWSWSPRCGGSSRCSCSAPTRRRSSTSSSRRANTAGDTGWLSSLRGTSHWVAFFPGGGQARLGPAATRWPPRGSSCCTTVLVAAVGLVGLLQKGLWAASGPRRRRCSSASRSCTAGSGGWAGSVFVGARGSTPSTPRWRRCATSTSSTPWCGSR